ncbi:sugar kinase [Paenibacillus baekrokdamisoli]|uniref:Sugar kinase n=1 Tax=Paenibacillus baekrokdamisoli TaxID=1712516 RepID=A0A3G9IKL7_9BACL|nr:ROK family protein [Paenibacillus baekrokdamisoli]MBB3069179.1 glucokinase [Paenibacillus baekrokdamisoli]BBH18846.1 sugar kinase [Paenibacillus baekrokdamisoli]
MKAIGIDIGGTSIKGMIVNDRGDTMAQTKIATDAAQGKDHIVHHVRTVIANLLNLHQDVAGIGIGTAGRVDTLTGEVVFATDNLPGWMGTNLKRLFEEEFNRPVAVDNDANTALIGEAWLGAGRGCSDVTMLTLGTGVGGANMVRGELVRGALWNGGEWGHVVFVPRGLPCNCGQRGCIEQYLSGTAFVRYAREATQNFYASGVEVLADYQGGNKAIVQMVNQFMDDLVIAVYNIHLGINPQAIVIGGGLADSKDVWWELFVDKVRRLELGIEVRAAQLGNQAGSIGAAKMVLGGEPLD